jgi:para-nitrobenzyl esterase
MDFNLKNATRWMLGSLMNLAASIGVIVAAASPAAAQLTVSTDKGYVTGYAGVGYRAFLGIPYAESTGGVNRWKPPKPRAYWGSIVTTSYGSICPQLSGTTVLSYNEDCLSVNVFAPTSGTNLPVMFWIHGGGFTQGAGSWYDGSAIAAARGVIVVTINYRLGPLGFLAHSSLTAEAADRASGQYGLQDQQFALNWVKTNIANFGGDPNNVTMFGESAGGISACMQITSPTATGLFHRAIIQSGSCTLGSIPLAQAQTEGATFASSLGCSTAACLRWAAVSTLLYGTAPHPSALGSTWYVPYGGTGVLREKPTTAIVNNRFIKVPMIAGATHDEWRLMTAQKEISQGFALTQAQYQNEVNTWMQPNPQSVLNQYPVVNYSGSNAAHAAVFGDAGFICGNRYTVRSMVANAATVYAFEFNDPTAPGVVPPTYNPYMPELAAHGTDLSYIFRTGNLDATQLALSEKMLKYWTNFAKSGNPNAAGLPTWPAYASASDQFLSFGATTVAPISNFAADHKCAFWDSRGY